MSNKDDITKKHSTEKNKDEQQEHQQKTKQFFGDVHVDHLYIFLGYVFW
jgi:hypothetical protein